MSSKPVPSRFNKKPIKSSAVQGANGRPLGKAALRSIRKNAEAADDYISRLSTASDLLHVGDYVLAHVERPLGNGRLEVKLFSGQKVQILIAGKLQFRGFAAKKAAQDNCLRPNDVALIQGGLAVCRLSDEEVNYVKHLFEEAELEIPKGFFETHTPTDNEEEGGFEWERPDPTVVPRRHIKNADSGMSDHAPTSAIREQLDSTVAEVEVEVPDVPEDDFDIDAAATTTTKSKKKSTPPPPKKKEVEEEEDSAVGYWDAAPVPEEPEFDEIAWEKENARRAAIKSWEDDEVDIDAI